MQQHSPRAFPLGVAAPVGAFHLTPRDGHLPRVRRPRRRSCLRKGCRRKYVPPCWDQRYCQDPDCQRKVRCWPNSGRLGGKLNFDRTLGSKPRTSRRKRSAVSEPKRRPRPLRSQSLHPRVVTQLKLFPLQICDQPGCYKAAVTSARNHARNFCATRCQAVCKLQDREHKWFSGGTLDGRKAGRQVPGRTLAAIAAPAWHGCRRCVTIATRVTTSSSHAGRQLSRCSAGPI
jgi:hypothetical protein